MVCVRKTFEITKICFQVNFDDWAAFEFYLERKGVVSAITNALYCLFNENPLPKNVNQ